MVQDVYAFCLLNDHFFRVCGEIKGMKMTNLVCFASRSGNKIKLPKVKLTTQSHDVPVKLTETISCLV